VAELAITAEASRRIHEVIVQFSMVDGPSPFAPLGVWRSFLAELEKALEAQPDDEGLQLAAQSARKWIAIKESAGETD
jgi:hypothetical protein